MLSVSWRAQVRLQALCLVLQAVGDVLALGLRCQMAAQSRCELLHPFHARWTMRARRLWSPPMRSLARC